MRRDLTFTRQLTATTLAGIAALHGGWGLGSPFPARNRADLADAMAGMPEVPPPAACFAVAGLLVTAAGVVGGAPLPVLGPAGTPERPARPLRRLAGVVIPAVLMLRGVLGLAGRTDLVSPGSTSERFRQLDRRYYGPLCVLLALGSRPRR